MSVAIDQYPENVIPHPALAEYETRVIRRESYRNFETTETGGTIYSELVHFQDKLGRLVTREATISEPTSNVMEVMPFPVIETDPWMTGPRGINRDKIRHYTDMGWRAIWLHHASRESALAKDKSVSRSAHQMHALLDDLQPYHDADLSQLVVRGYSRGDMTGEKFIATASRYGRVVPASDMEAVCFTRDMTRREKIEAIARHVPGEGVGLGKVGIGLLKRAITERNPGLLLEYAQTFDIHPKNVLQEVMWAHALINAKVGRAIDQLPLDTVGVRTNFAKDYMSQRHESERLYARLPGIQVITEKGAHVAGADPRYLEKSLGRLANIRDYILDNDMSLYGITSNDIAPEPVTATEKSKRRWGLTA
jgi:hypothetical protein